MAPTRHRPRLVRRPLPAVSYVVALLHRHRRRWLSLALVPVLWMGGAVAAPAVTCGELQPRPLPSWWCVKAGARVRVEGGTWGRNVAEGGAVDVVWAQGWWRSVEVDGVTVAGEHAVYLGVVR